MNDIIKDVIVNCLENLMINRIIEKDKKQLEVRMQEKQIKNDKLGNIYKELINIVNSYPDRSPNDVLRNIEFAPSYSMEKFESVIEILNIQIEDYKRQLNFEHLKRERRYDIENQISNRECAIKKINKIRDDYFLAEEKYRKFNKEDKASFDLYAGQEVKNKLREFNVVKKNTFISGLYVGEDPDSLNNSINKAREQLIESMRNDLKIEKS